MGHVNPNRRTILPLLAVGVVVASLPLPAASAADVAIQHHAFCAEAHAPLAMIARHRQIPVVRVARQSPVVRLAENDGSRGCSSLACRGLIVLGVAY